jgi:hypothetical protein
MPVKSAAGSSSTQPLVPGEGTSENSRLLSPQTQAPTKSSQLNAGGMFANVAARVSNGLSGSSKHSMPPRIEIGQKRFADGSTRPDKLVATRNETPGIGYAKAGFKGNHYGIPKYEMSGTPAGREPHTDSHMHDTNYVQRGVNMKRKLKMMNELGVRTSTSMPIPTSLISMPNGRKAVNRYAAAQEAGEAGHHCGPLESYYVPVGLAEELGHELTMDDFKRDPGLLKRIVDVGELYVDTAVNSHLAASIKNAGLTDAERSRIDPMLTGFHLADPRISDKFLNELAMNPGVFTGIGEITVNKELVQLMFAGEIQQTAATDAGPGKGDALLPLIGLMQTAGIVGAPVVLHCDIDDLKLQIEDGKGKGTGAPREPAHFEGLKAMFNDPRVRDTKVVWAHGGGLGRFVQQGDGHLEKLEGLLETCPNLYLDISWSEVAKQLTKPEHEAQWVAFLEKNSHRVCFGSDTLAPVDSNQWGATKEMYADLFAKLSPEAKENILNHTYENVFVASRDQVRRFEQDVLTPEFQAKHLHNSHVLGEDGQIAAPKTFAPMITPKVLKDAVASAAERRASRETASA